jgi:molybdopterin converting factor small subunit
MRVRVKYFAGFRRLMGVMEETYELEEGTRLITLLSKIIPDRHPELSERWRDRLFLSRDGRLELDEEGNPVPNRAYMILLNGRHYNEYEEGINRPLRDGDTIAILELVGGG